MLSVRRSAAGDIIRSCCEAVKKPIFRRVFFGTCVFLALVGIFMFSKTCLVSVNEGIDPDAVSLPNTFRISTALKGELCELNKEVMFPRFWGGSDDDMLNSPHDSSCVYKHRKFRLLFLVDHFWYKTMMVRQYFLLYEAARRNPHIEAYMWGVGWPEYDASTSLGENLHRRFGTRQAGGMVDAIVTHTKTAMFERQSEIRELIMEEERDGLETRTIVIVKNLECESYDTCNPSTHIGHMFLFPVSVEMLQYSSHRDGQMFVRCPLAAEPSVFYEEKSHGERSTSVGVAGYLDREFYPLRAKFAELVKENLIEGGKTRKHPGYHDYKLRKKKSDVDSGKISDQRTNPEKHMEQLKEYADFFKDSKIALVDSGKFQYPVQKYLEAAMAGCLVIGDIPVDDSEFFRSFVVEVDNEQIETLEKLREIVQWWVDHGDEREDRARYGQSLVLATSTFDHLLDFVLEWTKAYMSGRRGMFFSSPWRYPSIGVRNEKSHLLSTVR